MPSEDSGKVREFKIFDLPYENKRIQLGCICDNQSTYYNQPLVFQSNSPNLEISFIATKLNITEDFMDVYFYASYEMVKVPDCRQRTRLLSSGGEENVHVNQKRLDANCEGYPFLIEAKKLDHSLFVLTWGSIMSIVPTPEELIKCQTRNRLIIYSGHTSNVMRVICPSSKAESRLTALRIFSEDWMNSQFMLPTQ